MRYKKNKEIQKNVLDETYFNSNKNNKKQKGYLTNDKKKKLSVNDFNNDKQVNRLQEHSPKHSVHVNKNNAQLD